jgi:hypothetical protein
VSGSVAGQAFFAGGGGGGGAIDAPRSASDLVASALPAALKTQLKAMTPGPGRTGWARRLKCDNGCGADMSAAVPDVEDIAHDLIEWPYERRIESALEVMRRGGASDEEIVAYQV